MNIVAIHNIPAEREALGAPLATALGKTLYEANARLRAPGPGPLVVSLLDTAEAASGLKAKLKASGFSPVTVSDEEIRPIGARLSVTRLTFDDNGMKAETREGKIVEIAYSGVRLILHAMGAQSVTTTENIKETKIDVGKAVITGGLSFRKTTKRTVEQTSEEREPFVIVLAPGSPVLGLSEGGLKYDFLGDARQPSRAANFRMLVDVLRQRCPGAKFDDRLLQKPEQIKLLGPVLSPDVHLDAALTILAKALWIAS
jgi:hypothetical protein